MGINFSGGNSWSAVLGIKIPLKYWLFALTFNQSKDHEIDNNLEVFDGQGVEGYIAYKHTERLKFYGGFNQLTPRESEYNNDYQVQDLILGSEYAVSDLKFYFEAKLSGSQDHLGEKAPSRYGLGTNFYF